MSIEGGQVLGAATVAGGTGGALVATGNPVLWGVVAGLAVIIALGFITRAAQRQTS